MFMSIPLLMNAFTPPPPPHEELPESEPVGSLGSEFEKSFLKCNKSLTGLPVVKPLPQTNETESELGEESADYKTTATQDKKTPTVANQTEKNPPADTKEEDTSTVAEVQPKEQPEGGLEGKVEVKESENSTAEPSGQVPEQMNVEEMQNILSKLAGTNISPEVLRQMLSSGKFNVNELQRLLGTVGNQQDRFVLYQLAKTHLQEVLNIFAPTNVSMDFDAVIAQEMRMRNKMMADPGAYGIPDTPKLVIPNDISQEPYYVVGGRKVDLWKEPFPGPELDDETIEEKAEKEKKQKELSGWGATLMGWLRRLVPIKR